MTDDTMPDVELYLKEIEAEDQPEDEGIEQKELETIEEVPEPEPEENVKLTPREPEISPEDVVFDLPVKPKKKKKQLSEKQLANLAKAREKAAVKRKAIAAAKKKERELELAEKKAHIKKRKAKQLQQQAEIEAFTEDIVMKKEQSMWDEDKLVSLMNRTMDTYFEKRKAEKEKRAQIPVDPAVYSRYQPGMPPQRSIPKPQPPQQQVRKHRNPYSAMFGLSPEDEDIFNL
tara:strand:+ start:657 stop:1349 length:693 start_codon:yes stop_codon:yes gene_type:complete